MPLKKFDRSLQALALAFPVKFRFTCLGVTFDAVATVEGETCRLAVEADLGPVPFTAESSQARALRLALFNLDFRMPADRRFVERQQRLFLVTTTELEAEPTARRLVAAAIAQVMRCRPELALAAETAAVTARRAASRSLRPAVAAGQMQPAAEPRLQASAA